MLRGKTLGLCRHMTDDERRAGCGEQRGEPSTVRLSAGDVPAREDEWWWREAVRCEDCAAQPCLTVGVSGEHSEAVRVHCTPG